MQAKSDDGLVRTGVRAHWLELQLPRSTTLLIARKCVIMGLRSAMAGDNTARTTMQAARQMSRCNLIIYSLIPACSFLLMCSCSAGGHHPNDSSLIHNYWRHEKEFATLVARLRRDAGLEGMNRTDYFYNGRIYSGGAIDQTANGLRRDEWEWYQAVMRQIGVVRIVNDNSTIELRVTEGSLFNGDSTKGYLFSPRQSRNEKSSLDRYRISPGDRLSNGGYCAIRRIAGEWYLYLFVA